MKQPLGRCYVREGTTLPIGLIQGNVERDGSALIFLDEEGYPVYGQQTLAKTDLTKRKAQDEEADLVVNLQRNSHSKPLGDEVNHSSKLIYSLCRVWTLVDVDESTNIGDLVLFRGDTQEMIPPSSRLIDLYSEDLHDIQVQVVCTCSEPEDATQDNSWILRGRIFAQTVLSQMATGADVAKALREDITQAMKRRASFAPEVKIRATEPLRLTCTQEPLAPFIQVTSFIKPGRVTSPDMQQREFVQTSEGSWKYILQLPLYGSIALVSALMVFFAFLVVRL